MSITRKFPVSRCFVIYSLLLGLIISRSVHAETYQQESPKKVSFKQELLLKKVRELSSWRTGRAAKPGTPEAVLIADIKNWAAVASSKGVPVSTLNEISRKANPRTIERRLLGIGERPAQSCSNDCYVELQKNDKEACGDDADNSFDPCHTAPNLVFAACLADCILD